MATFVTYDKLSKIMDAIKTRLAKKLDASGIKNDASTTDSGYVLDARMGKTLGDRATTLETKVGDLYFDTDSSGNWGFKSSKNGAVKSFTATGAASTIESSNLAVSKALVSDANGKVAAAETTAAELGFLHGVTSAVQGQINSLNSNLANQSGSINTLNNAVSARYTENGRINLYVGSDGKLHFVNRDGADTALNFSNGKYTVTQFTISSGGGSSNLATFDFGAYFSSYSEFLKHSIVAIAGSDNSAGSYGTGFCIYNGQEHVSSNTRVVYPSSTSLQVQNYQSLPVGNMINFICIFT